jgi:general stress protein YciG
MAQKSLRGFAAMDPAKQRAIASKGGRAAHAKGTAHEFTPDEARAAGRKGGQSAHGGPFTNDQEQAPAQMTNPDNQGMAPQNVPQQTQAGMNEPMQPAGAFSPQTPTP